MSWTSWSGKLNRLPVETQKALQQLACLGNSAEFALLAMVYEDSKEEMHGDLWEAVRTGLVFRSEDAYRFLHDRVQEAAYSLIPEDAARRGPSANRQAARVAHCHQRSSRRRSSRSSISSTAALHLITSPRRA